MIRELDEGRAGTGGQRRMARRGSLLKGIGWWQGTGKGVIKWSGSVHTEGMFPAIG